MTEAIHLWPEKPFRQGDQFVVSVTIEHANRERQLLWYRLPASQRAGLTGSCDAFTVAVIFLAMRQDGAVRVHGQVSPSLLRNLEEYQDIWASWRPEIYRRVEIRADQEKEQQGANADLAVMGFSGGVDPAFTAWRHHQGQAGSRARKPVAGVFVHGFDIPLAEPEAYARAAEKNRLMLSSLGMESIPMATNFRELRASWEDAHVAGLASCLMLLQGRFRAGLIASSFPYPSLILPNGSNPVTDWLLSSRSFEIVHDGAAAHKIDKLREIYAWPEARKYMRTCWEGKHRDRNCCRCQKCVWTILIYRILGLERPECFEHDIRDWEIIRMRQNDMGSVLSTERLALHAKTAGIRASWVRALRISACINRLRLRFSRPGRIRAFARRIFRFFLPPFEDDPPAA
jgi:hypothetical protein